jgi:methylenetetrahydrofolate dehydrogenase (NADP+)/methenyltetrahydrofolate cyclohydrolase
MAILLDGRVVAQRVRQAVAEGVEQLRQQFGRAPGLAAVLIGDHPASRVYVRNKRKACDAVGVCSWLYHLPATTSRGEVKELLLRLNAAAEVDGILVQLPLPPHLPEEEIVAMIDPTKDVDGFHPYNYGLLAGGRPMFVPCTPLGVQRLLEHYQIRTEGRHVVIVGRSNLVGKPLALLLLQKGAYADAVVTVCHSRASDLGELTRAADILVAAAGRPGLIRASMVKPGAVVIDVGINRVGDRLVGDVEFEEVQPVVGAITPVPGGVGPMTVAMLLANTLQAARWRLEGPPRGR